MDTILIIITSSNSNEYALYWKRQADQADYYNCNQKLYIYRGNNITDIDIVKETINKIVDDENKQKEFLVCWHSPGGTIRIYLNEKEIPIYKYSTTMHLTDLWTYRSEEEWTIPGQQPKVPFDLLSWAINQSDVDNHIDTAITSVINYFRNNENKEKIENKLNILHKCLLPETISITEDDLCKLTEEEKTGYETFQENSKNKNGPFDPKYIDALIQLRKSFFPNNS